MGYRGKLAERERARELRAKAWTLQSIATELGVAKSSVSLWVRDVTFNPRDRPPTRTPPHRRAPNVLARRKQAQITELLAEGAARIGKLSDRDLLIAGTALYAGEGHKRDGGTALTNSDPAIILFFCEWLRRCFEPDESRLRAILYLHQGLDLEAATSYWSQLTGIPGTQFSKPYRAVPDAGIRHSKHEHGCLTVRYSCSYTHRRIMGLVHGLFECGDPITSE